MVQSMTTIKQRHAYVAVLINGTNDMALGQHTSTAKHELYTESHKYRSLF